MSMIGLQVFGECSAGGKLAPWKGKWRYPGAYGQPDGEM